MNTTVTISGPLFDGRAEKSMDNFVVDAAESLGQDGINIVKSVLRSSLKNPTGRYESSVQTERQTDDVSVNDSGIVYGPWLEGTSSRNQQTRFKGYASFRRASQELDSKTTTIVRRMLDKYIGEMN